MAIRTLSLLLAGCLLLAAPAGAQDKYPSRNIRLIVSFPPGGGIDAVARLFADKMTAILGQPVVVENRGGAAGLIAGRAVATAEPDGYTVLIASNSMIIAQLTNPAPGLSIENELQAVASVAPQANIVVAAPDLPASTLKEAIELARTRPLNYSSPGTGSVPQLLLAYLISTLPNIKITHVPFPGAAQALTSTLASQTELSVVTLPPAVRQRSAAVPQVPTVSEAGFPSLSATVWTGFFVPAKTPKALGERLGSVVLQVAAMPEIREKLLQLGFEPTSISGDQFQRDVAQEVKYWADVIQKSGIKAQ
ncbi:MAG: tripartite tricarboxylate transporter substrate binding protein [Alphaproteobacteria bacterium]|nr:tripartite tricarboxylate transporter substrate binding protein [Alphaproteobacteria bacterium]